MGKLAIHPIIYRDRHEPRDKESFLWLHRDRGNRNVLEQYNGTSWEPVVQATVPYISLERLRPYLYQVTFDALPDENDDYSFAIGGCSSFVQDGKLYRNLDFNYDNSASFIIKTKDFEGMSFITGLEDGFLDAGKIAQLPYRICDGVNNHGIKVSTHVLFNDWQWNGCGDKSISLTKLPFLVLNNVKSMATIAHDLSGILNNLYSPDGLSAMDYLIQILVTDGTTTYAILPPTEADKPYCLQDISDYPKLTNFRWISGQTVVKANLQTRPTGIERYNMMPCQLSDLRFTKAYEQPERLSEFIGLRGTTKDTPDSVLEDIYDLARELYLNRSRNGLTWHTMHSVVYGSRMESLYIQENWSDNILEKGNVTKAYVDSQLEGKVDKEEGKGLSENDFTDTDKATLESALQPSDLDAYRTSADQDTIDAQKVDKVQGKGLSTNDYTDAEKQKVDNAVQSVSGKGLSTNDYTNNEKGKVASAVQPSDLTEALEDYRTASDQDTVDSGKVDKVDGKGLSTNDYTDTDKQKVDAAISDAPSDDGYYCRKNGVWVPVPTQTGLFTLDTTDPNNPIIRTSYPIVSDGEITAGNTSTESE